MRCPTLSELPPPPAGRTGWPWTEESPQLPDAMPDGFPWPRIGIVTPSYNQGQFIEETIRSVLLQGYPNLEYIIIDGGSTDKTLKIIRKYEHWLSYWISEPDQGQTYAIEKGIKRASGIILNWLNSDDFLFPGALHALALAYKKHGQQACVLCGNAHIVNERGETIKESLVRPINCEDLVWPSSPPLLGGIQASWYFSSGAWHRVNGIDLELKYAMDTDLYFRFKEANIPFFHANHTIAAYRSHSKTKTRGGWKENVRYKKSFYEKQIKKLSPEEQSLYQKRLKRIFYGFYLGNISKKDNIWMRAQKIIVAIRDYPKALFSTYQIKRCVLLLLLPPDDRKVG